MLHLLSASQKTLCLSAFFRTGIKMVSLPWGETARSRYKGRVAKWILRSSSKQTGWLSNGSRHIGGWGNKRGSLGKSYASRKNRNPWDLTVSDRKPATSGADVTWVSAAEAVSENGCRSLQGEIEPRWYKSFCLSRFSKVLWWNYRVQGVDSLLSRLKPAQTVRLLPHTQALQKISMKPPKLQKATAHVLPTGNDISLRIGFPSNNSP